MKGGISKHWRAAGTKKGQNIGDGNGREVETTTNGRGGVKKRDASSGKEKEGLERARCAGTRREEDVKQKMQQ